MIQLPAFPAGWSFGDPQLITETFSSRIWKVRRDNGDIAIVKQLKPIDDIDDELRGAHYLRWRDGYGAVHLIAEDGPRLLLEYAGDTRLSDIADEAAIEVSAEVMVRLFSPSSLPVPDDLQPLRIRFSSLFKKAKTDRNLGQSSQYCQAADIAQRLLDTTDTMHPLHGDIHHDNIMHGPRGWLAIDPKGVFGDRCFDSANMFYNPLNRDALCHEPQRIAHMAEVFAKVLGQSPRRILDHAIAYGGLSAAWYYEDSDDKAATRTLAIAATIRNVRDFSF